MTPTPGHLQNTSRNTLEPVVPYLELPGPCYSKRAFRGSSLETQRLGPHPRAPEPIPVASQDSQKVAST